MTLITTPFGFHTTAAEVVEGIDLSGKRMIVTGGSSGIGVETARALVGAGAEVTLAVRNVEAGSETAAGIVDSTSMENIRVARLDLADRGSIAAFAAAWEGPLDVLINNAGVMACPEEHTVEGWEMQFATNHLGHFALSVGLHGALAAAAPARIVSVSSSAHFLSPVIFDDLHFDYRRYDPWLAYGQSKTANVLFAVGATKRWAGDGITANALMPGAIATNLQRHVGGMESFGIEPRSGQDDRGRRLDDRSPRNVAAPRRHRRPLLRQLQRGRGRGPPARRHDRRRPVRVERSERRSSLGRLRAPAQLSDATYSSSRSKVTAAPSFMPVATAASRASLDG